MQKVFEVKNLRFRYPRSEKDVLCGISFDVNKGEIFGLLGQSGAGKSTTQKILTKLLTDYSGKITYMDKDLKSYDNSFYEDIGVGFEMPVHFNRLTGLENMRYFSKLYKKNADIESLMTKVGLYEYKDQLVSEYSKGMKVRLNFVRSLLNNPSVLFLDEVTNGLDPKNAHIIKDMILDFKKNGGTVFLSTHLMNDVEQLCDNVAFISEGKICEMSSPRDLKIKYGKKTVTAEYNEGGVLIKKEFDLKGLGENEKFLEILKTKNIETLHSGETSLDEIFIKTVKEAKR
jgi:fluoroquinolone transport system ATP-binding protein